MQDQDATKLKGALEDAASLAHCALSQIGGIASLALLALETPAGQQSYLQMASALEALRYIAEDADLAITDMAKEQGVNVESIGEMQRMSAAQAAIRETQQAALRRQHPVL